MATRRADGRYVSTKKIEGRRIYGYGRTESEAELDLETKIAALSMPDTPSIETLAGYAQAVWWPRQRAHCSPLTLKRYRGILDKWIEPNLGTLPIAKISPIDCQNLIDRCISAKLSPKSTWLVAIVLSGICRHAVRTGHLHRNPCEGLAIPKQKPRRERSLTLAELRDLLAASESIPRLGIRVFLGAVLGLRRGEIAGLLWDDLDRERQALYIRRQIIDVKAGKGQREELPKGGKTRIIPLSKWMIEEIEILGDMDSPYIAGGGAPDLITKQWAARRSKLGYADWTFHDLRHCAASTLNALGVDLVTIAAILGHSHIDMTLLYANTVEGSARKAIENLGKSIDACTPDVVKPDI